jgi:anthranilate phosphoribosyltransferase
LDGYDEVSLTGPTKIITSSMEGAKSSGFWRLLSQSEIQGGQTIVCPDVYQHHLW